MEGPDFVTISAINKSWSRINIDQGTEQPPCFGTTSGPEYMNDFTGFLKSGFQLMSYVNEYTSHCHWLIRSLTSLRGMQNTKSRF